MKTHSIIIGALALMALSLFSCNESDTIGSSLLPVENSIIVDDDFTVTGKSVSNERIQSRTVTQLIGKIDAIGYGKFESDFVTQFMPAAALDTTLVSAEAIDSLKLVMMFYDEGYVGDSIVPMGLEVYRLNKNLEAPIFSDFNPADYYDKSGYVGSAVYNASDFALSDTLAELSYKSIYVDLPRSLAVELYDVYKNDPAAYLDPVKFSDYFHGFYVKNSYGSGRVTKLQGNIMQMYYHYDTKTDEGNDTTYYYTGNYYSVSPEIITNNNIDYDISNELVARVDAGETLVVAPAGLEVEIEFPLNALLESYRTQSGNLTMVNDLTFSVPASKILNDYGIDPPENLLLILKNKKQEFFENNSLTDDETSFTATFDDTTDTYTFASMRQYMVNMLAKSDITADDYTFVITPVSINTETNSTSSYYYTSSTSTVVSSIVPYVEQPAMARLNLNKAEIVLTFSNQNLKN